MPDLETIPIERNIVELRWMKSESGIYVTNFSSFVDVTGHDANFAFIGFDDTRTVGSDDSCSSLLSKSMLDSDHVVLGDTVSDDDDKCDFSLNGFHDGLCCMGRRNVDN